ncbi:hypothetical protein [Frondihabitans cladoniiphilus]|uniref:N-acetyltransferase domain-containing protein n=1 Tax=Frondihabitans cladoniiphilus TaxID=715785 RepID=A0ABP8VQN7_9MICO
MEYCFQPHSKAVEIRAYVRGVHPYAVRDLARWIHASGGPIDRMDASIGSLDVLKEWVAGFVTAGMPGLPEDPDIVRFSRFEHFDWIDADVMDPGFDLNGYEAAVRDARRLIHLDETLEHYFFEVAKRIDSDVIWDFDDEHGRIPDHNLHRPSITFESHKGPFFLHSVPRLLPARAAARRPVKAPSEAFRDQLADLGPIETQPEGPSVLAPLVDPGRKPMVERPALPLIREPEPAPPVRNWPQDTKVLVARGAHALDPATLTPLDADAFARGLRHAGFDIPSQADKSASGLASGVRVSHAFGYVYVTPRWHEGRLRGFLVESSRGRGCGWSHALALLFQEVGRDGFDLTTPTDLWLDRPEMERDLAFSPSLPSTRFPDVTSITVADRWPKLGLRWATGRPLPRERVATALFNAGLVAQEPRLVDEDGVRHYTSRVGSTTATVRVRDGFPIVVRVRRGDEGGSFWNDALAEMILLADDTDVLSFPPIVPARSRPEMHHLRLLLPTLQKRDAWRGPGDVLVLIDGSAMTLRPEELPRMSAEAIVSTLSSWHLSRAGRPLIAADLVDGARFTTLDSYRSWTVTVGARAGRVRAVTMELDSGNLEIWRETAPWVGQAARDNGLRFVLLQSAPFGREWKQAFEGHIEVVGASDAPAPRPMTLAMPAPLAGQWRPMPTGKVAAALRRAGFRANDGSQLRVADLVHDVVLTTNELDAEALVVAIGGKIRCVRIRTAGQTLGQWVQFYQELHAAAEGMGAHFVASDQSPGATPI